MRQTVLGVFDSYADARSAQRTLGEAGVAQADIAIYAKSDDAPVESGPRVYAPGSGDLRHHNPVFDQLEQLFARLFKSGQYPPETEDYRELIRRGGAIVSADVSEMQVDLARDLMRRTGAADIEERAKVWRNGSAGTSEEPSPGRPITQSAADYSSAGGRMVGGMQQVTTRTEGLGSTASVQSGQQLTGVPDVGLARPPEDAFAGVKSPRAAYSPEDSTSGIKTEETAGTGLVGDPVAGIPMDDTPYVDELREEYDAHYASTGASYDEYQRAYAHGATLGKDERYRGHDWQGVEANAREDWESRYPESGWERFKAAVRHGWDRVTGG